MKRAAVIATRVLVAAYAGLCGVLFLAQRSLLFHPGPALGGVPTTTLEVPGATLRIATQPHDGRRAVLYFGGNAEDVSRTIPGLAAALPGRAIYAPHYRGYGGSGGRPSEQALHADAAAVFDQVAAGHSEVDVIGRSLGSAVATRLAATKPVRRLVLVSLAGGLFPFLPVRLLVADRFETVADAPRIAVPTLVVTAGRDEVVPAAHTRRLLAAFAPGTAEERAFPTAGHNDISADPAYLESISRFLE
jgi:pimeloyl-ACP methyl ester carboxylesterase